MRLSLTSRVLVRVGDKFDERIGRVPVQVMRVPRFLGRDFYTWFGEHLRNGRRDFTEMCVVRVWMQKRYLCKCMLCCVNKFRFFFFFVSSRKRFEIRFHSKLDIVKCYKKFIISLSVSAWPSSIRTPRKKKFLAKCYCSKFYHNCSIQLLYRPFAVNVLFTRYDIVMFKTFLLKK